MDVVLGKITQHAMNYAIRAGIGITASYTIKQTSRLLKTVDDNADYEELRSLQEVLNSNIKILSPAIDIVEIISAKGNTNLASAVSMTKSLRWDIQNLGVRLAKAAAAEESSRKKKSGAISKTAHQFEIRSIIQDIRKLLAKIEKEVPLISLAITASGAKISTTMPASVSPSRMMQAGLYLAESNQAYFRNPDTNVQVGPIFTLSLYMLFAGHSNRVHENADSMRETTWKEVIHKARCKLMRIPLHTTNVQSPAQILQSVEEESFLRGKNKHDEYAYHIEIIEDLDDDRVHSFEDDEAQPGPYGGVKVAGIRDFLPVHQISKIFYADTGKILGIGNDGEPNSPVLLLKRDINAQPPRKMMDESEKNMDLYDGPEEEEEETPDDVKGYESGNDSQDDIDAQIRRESSIMLPQALPLESAKDDEKWRLPADLDTEWLAFEVYTEEEASESEGEQEEEEEQDEHNDSAYVSHRPSSSGEDPNGETLVNDFADMDINSNMKPASDRQARRRSRSYEDVDAYMGTNTTVRTSLSSLELLIRLASLQQYTQAPYLCATDEIINFFLEDSSTTGAGLDEEERRRTRNAARQKVGFDPYDESPIKRHGEDYQNQAQASPYRSRGNTPYDEYDSRYDYPMSSPRWDRESSVPNQMTPEHWIRRRNGDSPGSVSRRGTPEMMPSPISPYRPQQRKAARPLDRVQAERGIGKGSPLGRGMSVETDSTLGTSPGSPTLMNRDEKA